MGCMGVFTWVRVGVRRWSSTSGECRFMVQLHGHACALVLVLAVLP